MQSLNYFKFVTRLNKNQFLKKNSFIKSNILHHVPNKTTFKLNNLNEQNYTNNGTLKINTNPKYSINGTLILNTDTKPNYTNNGTLKINNNINNCDDECKDYELYNLILHYSDWYNSSIIILSLLQAVPILSYQEASKIVKTAQMYDSCFILCKEYDIAIIYKQRILNHGLSVTLSKKI